MPKASLWRRAFAAFVDEVFVLTLFSLALLMTLHLSTGMSAQLSGEPWSKLQDSQFLRFAALEFTTLWLGYFAIGLGLLDMTFGMWVWGLRVSFGRDSEDSKFLAKLLRIVGSFVFYAPVVPLILLTLRRKGRNVLDAISGTWVYRSVV
jgi:uncharacterized RDD family membrane protein YckC